MGRSGQMAEAAAARDPRIRVVGHLSGNALAQAYREAHVLVVPSLYEPWGLVVHEGLAYGLPVIATDQVGAADDLVDPDVNGFVVACGIGRAAQRGDERGCRLDAETARRGAFGARSRGSPSFSIERGVEGFVRGCTLAVEHRRGWRRAGVTAARAMSAAPASGAAGARHVASAARRSGSPSSTSGCHRSVRAF